MSPEPEVPTAPKLTGEVLEALEGANFWHVASLKPDGSPHVTPVWAGVRDDRVLFNTVLGRKKDRNLRNDGRVAVSTHIAETYTFVAIQGLVAEIIEGEQAKVDVNDLSLKYTGKDYEFSPDKPRVTFMIEPVHVWFHAWPKFEGKR